MVEVPLSWRLSIQGAEDVKNRLQEINSQFANGEIASSDYAKGLREVNRDARQLANIHNVNKNLNLALNPSWNLLSRSLSTVAHVSRAVMNITNALNLARLAGRAITEQEIENNRRMNEIQRELIDTTDLTTEEVRALNEEYNQLVQRNKELKDQNTNQWFSDILTSVSSVALGIGVFGREIIKLLPNLVKLEGALIAMNIRLNMSLGFLGLLATVFTTIALASYYLSDIFLSDLIPSWEEMEYWWYSRGEPMFQSMSDWFTIQLPIAFLSTLTFMQDFFLPGFMTIWNGIVSITAKAVNLLIGGLETLINSFIRVINRMISAYNRVARKVRLPTLSLIPTVQLPRLELPALTADVMPNFENNALQLGTGIPLTLSGGNSSGGASQQIIVNVAGSVITERELFAKMDAYLKEKLKDRGF